MRPLTAVDEPGAVFRRYNRGMTIAQQTAVINRLLDPVIRCLNAEAAKALIELRGDNELQHRIEELAGKCNEGELTPAERSEYEFYVAANDWLAIIQSRARQLVQNSGSR